MLEAIPTPFAIVAGGVIVLAAVIGYFFAANTGTNTATGSNDSNTSCSSACAQLQVRRSEVCTKIAESASADAFAASCRASYDSALSVSTALGITAAALWLSTLVPIFGLALVPLAQVASVLAAAAALVTAAAWGALQGAESRRSGASERLAAARIAEQEAVTIVLTSCSPEDASACLARPRPC